ncbi:MAG: tRNA uracil 4-sulfurtransferase ThiI [Candidatus Uhrbacteria bacterium]
MERPIIVIHYHEIALKGGNRERFERQLIENIRWALRSLGDVRVQRMSGRIVVRRCAIEQIEDIVQKLQKVFGIQNILVGVEVAQEVESLRLAATTCAESFAQDATFAVRVKRGNKQFPMTSMELERDLGAAVVESSGRKVKLQQPTFTVYVEIVERTAFVFTRKIVGPGGLPTGVSGRVLMLLSSGFDSPVASWMLMKRGCIVDALHFHSYPHTSDSSQQNVRALMGVINDWQQQRGTLRMCALADYQREVVTGAPSPLRVLLYRRMMLRIAERTAKALGALALATGESVGQVASQTLANMQAVGAILSTLLLRPLCGMDKDEILRLARQIGTAEISERPYDDCCTLFIPERPETRASVAALDRAEAQLDVAQWVDRLVVETSSS